MSGKKPVKTSRHFWLNTGMTIVFFAFLLCGATFAVLAFRPIYYWMIELLHVPVETGYSAEVCRANYDALIDYNMFFGPKILEFPDFPMSVNGAIHFKEVKTIFVAMQYTAMGSAVLLIAGIIAAHKKRAYGWLKATIILTVTVIAVVGFAMLINWNWTFTIFHKILFRNDYWIFNGATDPVIYILPDEVFLVDGAAILLLMGIGLLIAGLVYRGKKKQLAAVINAKKTKKKAK
ncbi:MAG: TIGR01906 family membrane protein [Lachnospiraceae bacterium]|nr:TIGR01906 family membrane protein [Lachnospiraceae bacterium]